MQTPYKPRHPKDRIYAHDSNPVPAFNALDIGSSRPGSPTKDAPMYIGMFFIRKSPPEYPNLSWEKHDMPETQQALGRRVSKYGAQSVDYDNDDMRNGGKQAEVDRFIQMENSKYPGYEYKLRLLLLKEGRNSRQKRICKQMTVILQRQPASTAKPKSQSEEPKQDLRNPFSGPPIKKQTQPSYGHDIFGHRNEDLRSDPATMGLQHRPHDQHNRPQSIPIHDPNQYIPPPPLPQHYNSGAEFQSLPHAHPEEDPKFQMPHSEGGLFDGAAQNDRFSNPYLSYAGPPQVSFEDQQNHGGLGHHPTTQGSHHTSRPRSGAGLHPIMQEVDPCLQNAFGHPNLQDEFNPRPHSGAGHHADMQGEKNNPRPQSGAVHNPITQEYDPRPQSGVRQPNFQDDYNPRPRSGAGNHLNMQGETNHPGPVNREGGHFDSRDHHQAHAHGGAGDRFDSRDHHQTHPHGGADQLFDVNGEFPNRPRGGGGSHFEDFQVKQPHLPAQSKRDSRSGDTSGGVYGAGRTQERKVNRDSGFFSGASSDGGRSDYRNDENIPKVYSESRGSYPYSRNQQHGRQKDNYQSRDRSNDRDNGPERKNRKDHAREQLKKKSDRRGSHHSPGSAHDQYESDYNGRNTSHNKNRHHRRNTSRMMDEGYGDINSNGYVTPGDDYGDWYSETDSLRSGRGSGSPQTLRRSKRMPHVPIYDPRDRQDILNELDQEWKRREAKKRREERERQVEEREREEARNERVGKGRRSDGGTLTRPRFTTHRR